MKAGDRVVAVGVRFNFDYHGYNNGDEATVLNVIGDVCWVYPDKWEVLVPYEYRDRRFDGLPYLRIYTDKLKRACMFS